MKFLTKINRNYFLMLSLLIVMISFAGYFILKTVIFGQTKESLLEKAFLIKKQISETGKIPSLYPLIEVTETVKTSELNPALNEVFIREEGENEQESYTEYSEVISVGTKYYLVKIRQANVESEDLIMAIAIPLLVLMVFTFGFSGFITKKMNQTIWADFESNLSKLENFTFENRAGLQLKNTNIHEFDRLNDVVTRLTKKLNQDYDSLKEFSENASHEIQTPLSIALLNLEEIIQQDLPEVTFKKIVSSINALKRLSRLNENLILITKIENNQFPAGETINFTKLFRNKVEDFEPLIRSVKIEIIWNIENDFYLKINSQLADVIINNLLSNAINHNLDSGFIRFDSSLDKLVLSNPGPPVNFSDDKIFDRFVKGNSKSFGLGLSIVKKICGVNGIVISYSFGEFHSFTLSRKS